MNRRPRIVIANMAGVRFFDDEDLDVLAAVGDVLDPEPIGTWDDPRCDRLLPMADVILGHWGCPAIDVSVIDRSPDLGLIAYAAGTVKGTIDPAVLDRVRVTSGADANAEPVAEFTLAMILLANKDALWLRDRIRDRSIADARDGRDFDVGNWDKNVGIVGASIIGRRVIELLKPFPTLRPLVFDPFLSEGDADAMGAEKVELADLCRRCHVVSIHAPDLPSTHGLIGAAEMAQMRPGTTLINTARGRLLDHDALVANSRRLYAVLDVTHPEPLPRDHPLRSSPTVFLTPHIAGSQGTELRRMARYAADEIRLWADDEPGRNVITRDMLDRIA